MSPYVTGDDALSGVGGDLERYAGHSHYQFPESVRLLNDPLFKSRLLEKLHFRLEQSSDPQLYRSIVDTYRRAGDLVQAAEYASKWAALEPDNPQVVYLVKLLLQQPLSNSPYTAADIQPAPVITIDHFLDKEEREYFWCKAMASEKSFEKAGMGYGDTPVIDCSRRDTEVLKLDGKEKKTLREKIDSQVEGLFEHLQWESKPVKKIEVKLTAHTQGGFFQIHQDRYPRDPGVCESRQLSWVCYFHAQPKRYRGGDLVLFDSSCQRKNHQCNTLNYTRYVPKDNQLVFFPSCFFHAVTPVSLMQAGFESSRFALVGHVRC